MILGITGKSGVGKHTAATFFEQKNWKVLDVDKMAHRLYHPYQRVWREVVDRFGEGILKTNDKVDRQKLKLIVFANTPESREALKDLNAIVHPELKRVLKDESYFLNKRHKNTVVIAALWDEIDLSIACDKILLIKAEASTAYDRIKKRDGISEEMFKILTARQTEAPNPDYTIVNEDDLQSLNKQLNQIASEL